MSNSPVFKLAPETIKELSRRSDWKGLVQLGGHCLLLLLTGTAIAMSFDSVWLYPALLMHGVVLIFLFSPLHETIHYTAFKSRWMNNACASVAGFILFLPFQYFRAFHMAHHRYTQDPLKDPERVGSKPMTGKTFWLTISGIPVWKESIVTLYKHCLGEISSEFIDSRKHRVIIREARIHIALYVVLLLHSVISGNGFIWWFWLLPVLLGQPALRIFLLSEHSDCDESDNMLENSRTTYTTPLLNFLCWNMAYHAEHHYLAAVPFHALPALHAFSGQQVKHRSAGYSSFIRQYKKSLN